MGEIRYQVTTYGNGFKGPGRKWLGAAINLLRLKMSRISGPFTIDDTDNPNDADVKRNRRDTLIRVKQRMASADPGLRLIIRGAHYDEKAFAIRKIDVSLPHPLIDACQKYIHNSYLLGAIPPPRSDCSGLTMKVVGEVYHYTLPHSAYLQSQDKSIKIFRDPSELRPDDFIFYVYGRLGSLVDHVALAYSKNGYEIGARPSLGGVEVGRIDWPHVVSFGRLVT
jgi:cell wall-associated NlpC family hydrolase